MNSTSNVVVIFGASDPEATIAKGIARSCGYDVAVATKGGQPVTPPSAYEADGINPMPHPDATVVAFECGGPAIPADAVVIDHHRPGDPGYSRPPEEFLAASSLGQLVALAARRDELDKADWPYSAAEAAVGDFVFADGRWVVGCPRAVLVVPAEVILASAADHCLEKAYRGLCPGVDPDQLMRWRIASRAAYQKRPPEKIEKEVEAARAALRAAPVWAGHHLAVKYQLKDFTAGSIPELPEAAAREGLPFIACLEDKAGKKIVVQAAPPELVEAFLKGEIMPLRKLYGDPARGFAGGYIS